MSSRIKHDSAISPSQRDPPVLPQTERISRSRKNLKPHATEVPIQSRRSKMSRESTIKVPTAPQGVRNSKLSATCLPAPVPGQSLRAKSCERYSTRNPKLPNTPQTVTNSKLNAIDVSETVPEQSQFVRSGKSYSKRTAKPLTAPPPPERRFCKSVQPSHGQASKTLGSISRDRKSTRGRNFAIDAFNPCHSIKKAAKSDNTDNTQSIKEVEVLVGPSKSRSKALTTVQSSVVRPYNGVSAARTDLGPDKRLGTKDMKRFVKRPSEKSFTNKTVRPSGRTNDIQYSTVAPSETVKGTKRGS